MSLFHPVEIGNVKLSGNRSDFSRNKSHSKVRFNPNKVEKYDITQDIFVESYQKKRQFIDNLAERELKFQKQLLQLKTNYIKQKLHYYRITYFSSLFL